MRLTVPGQITVRAAFDANSLLNVGVESSMAPCITHNADNGRADEVLLASLKSVVAEMWRGNVPTLAAFVRVGHEQCR